MEHNGTTTASVRRRKGSDPSTNPSDIVNAANSNTRQQMNRFKCNDVQAYLLRGEEGNIRIPSTYNNDKRKFSKVPFCLSAQENE